MFTQVRSKTSCSLAHAVICVVAVSSVVMTGGTAGATTSNLQPPNPPSMSSAISQTETALAGVPGLLGKTSTVALPGQQEVVVGRTAGDGVDLKAAHGQRISITLPGEAKTSGTAVKAGVTVYQGTDPGVSEVVQKTSDGARLLTVIKSASAPSSYRYNLHVPAGGRLVSTPDGGATVQDARTDVIATIAPAWATDARGKSVRTSYTVAGTALVQHVDIAGAVLPVVADPSISFGWYVYVHLNPSDQRALITGGALGAAAIGGLVCAELGPGDVICAVGAAVVGGILASYIGDYYHPRCTVVVKFNYYGSIAGRYTENCR